MSPYEHNVECIEAIQSLKKFNYPESVLRRAINDIEQNGREAIDRWLNYEPTSKEIRCEQQQLTLINEGAEIEKTAYNEINIDYTTALFSYVTLPRSLPDKRENGLHQNQFVRKSGDYQLIMFIPDAIMKDDEDITLPYGSIPRLLNIYICNMIKQTKEQHIHLGHTLTDFIRSLGLKATYGKRGNVAKIRAQLKSYAATNFTITGKKRANNPRSFEIHNRHIIDDATFWWQEKGNTQGVLTINHTFYTEVMNNAFPISNEVVRVLHDKTLALDIYTWLTHRFYSLGKPITLPIEYLHNQFGEGEYKDQKVFRKNFKLALKHVQKLYPDAENLVLNDGKGSATLFPAKPHVKTITPH